ncbi:MAG: Na/Pi symporter [Candidatus Marinimicrobia bacterium]|jgi:solute carrier family 34 (sodium-dependent phosphate cotransporter)|nr:Na/Pi symporter [Candidatus Neomarinimicrobiota bacterium]MBT3633604.1 Na/Pi symporter [Candidatus Neomarinimicrobiota bacterium]MBT3682443.1 Na/Pi symporter [Candidatus Neomarinimicrobiota bacterium]MBT3759207.1 Na/Pi symporter [Candidatus Neomarinimicrobiota bacterium]MBT3895520.1 Na/Pi symporter [Candidatus Neomarinimicrobiota bacterium]
MSKELQRTLINSISIIAFLYLFLVGINGMSSAIKHFGSGFADTVLSTTDNPFLALFIGTFATVLFQSSSTTTSLIVGMVSAGVLSIEGSIPMIMGANIGTTVTNTIVSMGHISRGNEFKRAFAASTVHDFFNMLSVLIMFPLELKFHFIQKSAIGLGEFLFGNISSNEVMKSPIKTAVKWGSKQIEILSFDNNIFYLILSVLLTLFMLYMIVKVLRKMVLSKVEVFFDKYIFKTAIRALLFGMLLTFMVQSSSITTSLIVPLAGAGVLSLRQIFPYTLGANIGTTATALLAALSLNVTALVTAFAHLIFNIFGILIIYPIPFIRNIPIKLAETLAEYSIKNRLIPFAYLLIVFIVIPFTIIYFGGK